LSPVFEKECHMTEHNSENNVIDKSTIQKIARLARMDIQPDREDALCAELSTIISWVEQLGECNTADVEPLASVTGHSLPLRDDVVTAGNDPERVLSNAPEEASHFFVLPKVVE
jgi:aspartyl-tRNA(Asn)/glutamyl-tRNA(Gln) amidotransferase subunit C